MSPTSSKDFGPIRDDYRFFEEHATEADEDVRAYAPLVHTQVAGQPKVRMLDYGCGGGRFSTRFLEMANVPPDRLELTLIEPVEIYRTQAAAAVNPYSTTPITALPSLPEVAEQFDLILANHVLYYVTQLDEEVAALVRALAPRGLFLAAMAGQNNMLIQFWNRSFALINQPVPFHTGEDLQATLDANGFSYRKQPVTYRLQFADCVDHRLSIMRFLLGRYFDQVPQPELIAMFDEFATLGEIAMNLTHDHYIVRPR